MGDDRGTIAEAETLDAALSGARPPAGDDATLAAGAQAGSALGEDSPAPSEPGRASRWAGVLRALTYIGVVGVLALDVRSLRHQILTGRLPRSAMDLFGGGAPTQRWTGLARWLADPRVPYVRAVVVSVAMVVVSLLFSRRRRGDAMLQIVALGFVATGGLGAAITTLGATGPGAPGAFYRILAAVMYVSALFLTAWFLVLFPDGKPVPRWAAWAPPLMTAPLIANCVGVYAGHAFNPRLSVAGIVTYCAGLWFQRLRYRVATVRQRHQILWLAYALSTFVGLQFLALLSLRFVDPRSAAFPFQRALFELLVAAAYMGLLVGTAFGATRYRLFAIDRLINRSLVYGSLTALLAVVAALSYVTLRTALGALWPAYSALVSGVVVVAALPMLFVSARRALTRWVDRRIYGIGLDYAALARKARQLASLPVGAGERYERFEGLQLLGRGGMGAVYKASHPDFEYAIALKVLSPEAARVPRLRARFEREAEILERIDHPHVVPYLSHGPEHLAMTFIEGQDLAHVLAARRLSRAEALQILDGIGSALDRLHAEGFVHRDVKPANVFIESRKEGPWAYLMDFGVALRTSPRVDDEGAVLVGTLEYIAPEQLRASPDVDGRVDVYALGVTAFEMLTGRPPFQEDSPLGMAIAHLLHPPPDPRSLGAAMPEAMVRALFRALEKDPAARFAHAGEFVAALRSGDARRS